jgi:methylglyoxal synthase
MTHKKITRECAEKKIALIAHGHKKGELVEWAKSNRTLLAHHRIYATGATGTLLEQELGFEITKLQSGPLGGDQQIGARIANGEIDFVILFSDPLQSLAHDPDSEIDFVILFSDPLESLAHDPDSRGLLRMAIVCNIPIACNRASADFMISSPLMDEDYDRLDSNPTKAKKIIAAG